MAKLPNKPSALIHVALKDLELCEADPRYEVNMADWHEPDNDGTCYVCLAGAVMAKTCGANPKERFDFSNFHGHTPRKLEALDAFRVGAVEYGLELLKLKLPEGFSSHRTISTYLANPPLFKMHLRRLAKDLEAVGL